MHIPQLIGQHPGAAEQEFGGIAVVVPVDPAIGAGLVDQLVQLYGERDDIAGQDEQRGLGAARDWPSGKPGSGGIPGGGRRRSV